MTSRILPVLGLLCGVGCVTLQPIGPFAESLGGRKGPAPAAEPKDAGGGPVFRPAPPPPAPNVRVTPARRWSRCRGTPRCRWWGGSKRQSPRAAARGL